MSPHFTFEIDRAHDLVKIVLTGLFMPSHVTAFFEARRKAHTELACAPGEHVTLTDVSALDSMTHETADAFAALLTAPESRARKLAFVVSPRLLLRGQLSRVLAGRQARFFLNPEEAEAWLIEVEDKPPQPWQAEDKRPCQADIAEARES